MTFKPHSITADDVQKVARLARLAVEPQDLPRIAAQLEPIVGYIEQLNELETTGVIPMAHAVPLQNVLRDDVIEPSLPLHESLRNAPDVDGSFFRVPKVIGEEDSAG